MPAAIIFKRPPCKTSASPGTPDMPTPLNCSQEIAGHILGWVGFFVAADRHTTLSADSVKERGLNSLVIDLRDCTRSRSGQVLGPSTAGPADPSHLRRPSLATQSRCCET